MSLLKGGLTGLSAQIKDKLIQQSLERRLKQAGLDDSAPAQAPATAHTETRKMPRGAPDTNQRTDAQGAAALVTVLTQSTQ